MNSICFDTETTGLHPNGSDPDEILTISIIGRDGSVLLDERFRPTVKTEWPHASAINGIYPEDVADLPTIETAIPRLREIFRGQVRYRTVRGWKHSVYRRSNPVMCLHMA